MNVHRNSKIYFFSLKIRSLKRVYCGKAKDFFSFSNFSDNSIRFNFNYCKIKKFLSEIPSLACKAPKKEGNFEIYRFLRPTIHSIIFKSFSQFQSNSMREFKNKWSDHLFIIFRFFLLGNEQREQF